MHGRSEKYQFFTLAFNINCLSLILFDHSIDPGILNDPTMDHRIVE